MSTSTARYVGRIRAQQFVEIHARVEGYLERMCFKEGSISPRVRHFSSSTRSSIRPMCQQGPRHTPTRPRAQGSQAKHDLDRITPLCQNAARSSTSTTRRAAYESAQAEVTVSRADLTQAELTLGYHHCVVAHLGIYLRACGRYQWPLVGPSGGKSLLATVVKSDTVRVDFSMTSLDYLRSKRQQCEAGRLVGSRSETCIICHHHPCRRFGISPPRPRRLRRSAGRSQDRNILRARRDAQPRPQPSPGEYTKVKVLLDVSEKAVDVPPKLLVIEKNGAYVFVVRPDSVVEKRFIEKGPETGNNTIIERGLAAGEKIVVEGYHKLTHGMKVEPRAPPKSKTAPLPRWLTMRAASGKEEEV